MSSVKVFISLFCFPAMLFASVINSSMFLFFKAEISTTLHCKISDNLSASIKSLFFSTTSIMLRAAISGIPISLNCVARYKFLSIFDASITSIITSGFSFNK